MTKSGPADVVLPPPAKLLQMVRSQFVTTLYKALSGMVENAEKFVKKADDDWTMEAGGLASPVTMITATNIGAGTVNASDRVSFTAKSLLSANHYRMCECC
jgi:exocyst complex component 2